MKKLFVLLTALLMVTAVFSNVVNPDTYFNATIGEPDTLDVHQAYDTASSEVIFNVYENLVEYDGESMSKFLPRLSTEVPSVDNGYLKDDGKTYVFHIRKGVKFHNGNDLTPSDVEYTFERALLADPSAGPLWMVFEALFGSGTYDVESMVKKYAGVAYKDMFDAKGNILPKYKDTLINFYKDVIDPVVEVKGDDVYIHLAAPFAAFLNIIAQGSSWGAILDKEWSASIGLWDGNPDGWWKYHDWKKEDSPLYAKTNGTGPFMLESWDRTQQRVTLVRNDNYWRTPAKLKKVIIAGIDEWSTRKAMLEKGEADQISTPAEFLSQVEQNPDVFVKRGLSSVSITALSFNWSVKADSKYIGSGKFDGQGIPTNFFEDQNVRLGFAYSFDYQAFIKEVLDGEGYQTPTVLPQGFLGYNDNLPKFKFDLKLATKYFKRAYRGKLWQRGFKMTILYNTGNKARQKSAEILRDNLKKINPKFDCEVKGVQWPTFLDARKNGKMPVYIIGWLADYPDPHNFIFTYYDSNGDYGSYYGANFAEFANKPQPDFGAKSLNKMIEDAAKHPDPSVRQKLYEQIQKFVNKYAVSMPLYQPYGSRVQRKWVKGWVRNPIWPGTNYYPLYKSDK
ncbi:peptide ABC transporter substrate-binding protein [Tepiditoga spiralis]|uniref:Peptide ABC transporter substrate-binding protein n=1 Tax=Tepiditoga spiralis TaxID=2108365 RepID=A0A7G1G1E9_9BACT|nr:ABC transporter substrate-binding protein [Tepiditoga spiralis]BBE29990.1 peptide ABC transporter substrate-binding protein [Tepiditoga spiralis]